MKFVENFIEHQDGSITLTIEATVDGRLHFGFWGVKGKLPTLAIEELILFVATEKGFLKRNGNFFHKILGRVTEEVLFDEITWYDIIRPSDDNDAKKFYYQRVTYENDEWKWSNNIPFEKLPPEFQGRIQKELD